jgi:DNA-binding LytR/AlgR family response regulator
MRLILNERPELEKPEVTIAYSEMTASVKRVADFVRSLEQTVLCKKDEEECSVPVGDIFYIESVDKKTFVYCEKEVYMCSLRLYEIEKMVEQAGFVRVSKSTILNIEQLKGVKTLVNSRLEAILFNGERVCVTRKYLKDIREALIRRNS